MGPQRLGPKAGVGNAERRRAASAKAGARHFPTFHRTLRLRLQRRVRRQPPLYAILKPPLTVFRYRPAWGQWGGLCLVRVPALTRGPSRCTAPLTPQAAGALAVAGRAHPLSRNSPSACPGAVADDEAGVVMLLDHGLTRRRNRRPVLASARCLPAARGRPENGLRPRIPSKRREKSLPAPSGRCAGLGGRGIIRVGSTGGLRGAQRHACLAAVAPWLRSRAAAALQSAWTRPSGQQRSPASCQPRSECSS